MVNFFVTCLLIMPFLVNPFKDVLAPFRLPKELFFDIICLGMIYFALKDGVKFLYKNSLLALLSLWVFITIIFNWYLPLLFSTETRGLEINLWTLLPQIHFILALIASYIALSTFERDDYVRIAKALCLTAFLTTMIGIMQVFGFDPLGKLVLRYDHPNHFYGYLDNPNLMGNYLSLCLPFFLFFKNLRYKIGFFIILYGVYLSHSRLSVIAIFIGIFVFMFLNYRKHKIISKIVLASLIIGIPIFVFFYIYRIQFDNFGQRTEIWQKALVNIKHNPLFGQGLGIFKTWEITGSLNNVKWYVCHNDWLERIAEIGFLGLGFMLLVLFRMFRNFNYSENNRLGFAYMASFVTFLFLMGGSFVWEVAPTALIGLVGWWGCEKL